MKNVFKIMALLFSFSLIAENAVESAAIAPISNETSSNISQENGNKDKDESKIEKIVNFLEDHEHTIFSSGITTIFSGIATVGALQVLDYIAVLAHECGHILPSLLTGNDFTINIQSTGDPIFPFRGNYVAATPSPFTTDLLGPIAGVSTTYLQCAAIKALYDHRTQNKSFTENFKQALKFPITFFTNIMNDSEKGISSYLNKKPLPPSNQEKITPDAFIVNAVIFFRTMHMIAESIYGFLPYDTGSQSKGDGEKIWHALLGKQPPTFKVDLGAAAVAVMATPVAIGAMKAVYKKINEKSGKNEKTEEIQLPVPIIEEKA